MTRDIVLLTVDSLSTARISSLGYERETTPHLDQRAEDGVRYDACIAQSSHTPQSMPSLLYSAYPSELESIDALPTDRATIATALSEAGYETAGFHSNPFLSRAHGFDRGFDHFDDSLPLATNRLVMFAHRVINYFKTQPYTRAETLNERALSWLDSTDADHTFLWLHYMDPHGPYLPPARFQEEFRNDIVSPRSAKKLWRTMVDSPEDLDDGDIRTLIDLHDAEIRYTDAMIDAFLESLADRGRLTDTTVVVAADHGELFGEHGQYGHPRQLYEPLINVPLFVLGGGVGGSQTVTRPVENVDIGPTLLSAADAVPSSFVGTPLPGVEGHTDERDTTTQQSPPFDERRLAFAETQSEDDPEHHRFAVRHDRYKYCAAYTGADTISDGQLYDLQADPEETEDIGPARSEVRDELAAVLERHVSAVTDGATSRRRATGDSDDIVEQRLEDLGYR